MWMKSGWLLLFFTMQTARLFDMPPSRKRVSVMAQRTDGQTGKTSPANDFPSLLNDYTSHNILIRWIIILSQESFQSASLLHMLKMLGVGR